MSTECASVTYRACDRLVEQVTELGTHGAVHEHQIVCVKARWFDSTGGSMRAWVHSGQAIGSRSISGTGFTMSLVKSLKPMRAWSASESTAAS